MIRKLLLVGTVLVTAATGGCKNDSIPVGTAATVTVRMFVDADGSGGYNAGDVPIVGTVTLTPNNGGAAVQAMTDATGAAVFNGVVPGSYTATATGTIPSGAVLSTAASATVVVPFVGGAVSTDFRYVYNPGSITGVLFRDDNGNGVYDAGVDTPAPGIVVNLQQGTNDANSVVIATTTTDGGGHYQFLGVRPGTYNIEIVPIPTIQIVGGVQFVTVGAAATSTLPFKFTGNLLSPISQVRTAAAGATVAFLGVATANAGLLASNNLYVQDATAGVLVFGAATAGIVAGDTVRVIGVVSSFNQEEEIIGNATTTLSVTKVNAVPAPVPNPKLITVTQLLSGAFLGQLVKVQGVKVRSVVTTSGTAYNVNLQGVGVADTFQVRVGNTNTIPIPSTFWQVGAAYDVTAVDGFFNGEHQVKPRVAADAALSNLNLLTIAAAKNVSNDTVNVQGVVVATRTTFRVDNMYIEDATSGVQIFNVPATLNLVLGDSVRIHGKMTVFSGENEITNNITPSDSIKIFKFGSGAPVAPKVITGAQFLARTFEGQLVTVNSVTIVTVGAAGGTGTYTVTGTAPDGSAMTIFMSAPTGSVPPPAATYTVGSRYNLTGMAVPFGTPSVEELKPRGAGDVVAAP